MLGKRARLAAPPKGRFYTPRPVPNQKPAGPYILLQSPLLEKGTRLRAIRLAVVLVLTLLAAAPAFAAPRWTQATPFGGDVLAVAQAPSAPRLLYALSVFGQVFASRDGGATWGLRGGVAAFEPVQLVELSVNPREPAATPGTPWRSRTRSST
jgi:hypothetical protein